MLNERIFSLGMAAIYAAHPNLKTAGDTGMIALKKLLDHIPDNVFQKACESVARNSETPWALVAAIERSAAKYLGFLDADSAYDLITEMMECFYMPGLGETSCRVIYEKLRERKQEGLIPYFNRFGAEIWNQDNPTATRAQFKRAYEAKMEKSVREFLLDEPKRRKELENKNLIAANTETIQPEDWRSLKNLLGTIASENGNGEKKS